MYNKLFCIAAALIIGLLLNQPVFSQEGDEVPENVIENQKCFHCHGDRFYDYYKDLQKRIKRKEVDLVLVVNMFLTGFDSPRLNTLYVDKNLRYHGLLQAYSRTNRLLNSDKPHGNIISFRNLKDATDKSLALYGDENAREIVFKKPYEEQKKAFGQRKKIKKFLEKHNNEIFELGYDTLVDLFHTSE